MNTLLVHLYLIYCVSNVYYKHELYTVNNVNTQNLVITEDKVLYLLLYFTRLSKKCVKTTFIINIYL